MHPVCKRNFLSVFCNKCVFHQISSKFFCFYFLSELTVFAKTIISFCPTSFSQNSIFRLSSINQLKLRKMTILLKIKFSCFIFLYFLPFDEAIFFSVRAELLHCFSKQGTFWWWSGDGTLLGFTLGALGFLFIFTLDERALLENFQNKWKMEVWC